MDEKKRKKRQSISISRKNVLDLGFTIGIILIACLVSSLLVHYSKSSANVTAVFTLAGAGDGRIWVGHRRLHHRRDCRQLCIYRPVFPIGFYDGRLSDYFCVHDADFGCDQCDDGQRQAAGASRQKQRGTYPPAV